MVWAVGSRVPLATGRSVAGRELRAKLQALQPDGSHGSAAP